MLTATVRGMLAHKLRLVLTTASIALGVAFLAGTLDTHRHHEGSPSTSSSARSPPAPTRSSARRRPITESAGVGTSPGPDRRVRARPVAHVDGVAAAEGCVSGYALLTDTEGRAVLTNGGAPTMGYSMPRDEALRGDVNLLSGHAPRGPHEVAIDATSAEDHDIALGSHDQGPLPWSDPGVHRGRHRRLRRREGPRRHAPAAYFDTATAQRVLGQPGHVRRGRRQRSRRCRRRGAGRAARRGRSRRRRGRHRVRTVAKESADAINEELHVRQHHVHDASPASRCSSARSSSGTRSR